MKIIYAMADGRSIAGNYVTAVLSRAVCRGHCLAAVLPRSFSRRHSVAAFGGWREPLKIETRWLAAVPSRPFCRGPFLAAILSRSLYLWLFLVGETSCRKSRCQGGQPFGRGNYVEAVVSRPFYRGLSVATFGGWKELLRNRDAVVD